MKSIAFLSLCILGANAGYDFIDPCHWSNKECILKSANKALPFVAAGDLNMGLISLDPLDFKGKTINGDAGELKLEFKDMIVEKLSHCKIVEIERPTQLNIQMTLECPFVAKGIYKADGNVLKYNVFGNGGFKISTEKMSIVVAITMAPVEKDGKHHYKFTKFDYNYEPISKFEMEFSDLFNGDAERAEIFLKFINENWKEIINVMGKPIISECIKSIIQIVNKVFLKIPLEQLELP